MTSRRAFSELIGYREIKKAIAGRMASRTRVPESSFVIRHSGFVILVFEPSRAEI